MSSDFGIYILQSLDGYRIAHTQAIENIYFWYTCCDNPIVDKNTLNIINDEFYYNGYCINCDTVNPESER